MCHRLSLRRAFTRMEVVVVFIIIAVAVTFFLMVIPRAGGAAHKNSCRLNQMRLSLALQNYADAHRVYPPLYFSNDPAVRTKPPLSPRDAAASYSWQTKLLPFLEEPELAKAIKQASQDYTLPSADVLVSSVAGEEPTSPRQLLLKQFRCPGVPDRTTPGNGNYAATSATRWPLLVEIVADELGEPKFKIEPDGLLIPDRGQRGHSGSRVSDGLSKTILIIESREAQRADWYDPQQTFVVGFVPADSTPVDAEQSDYYPYFAEKQTWTFNPTAGDRTALNYGPSAENTQSAYNNVQGDALARTWGPSSGHPEGAVIAAMGDSSVQEIWPDVDPKVFFAAITARGAETVPNLPPPKFGTDK